MGTAPRIMGKSKVLYPAPPPPPFKLLSIEQRNGNPWYRVRAYRTEVMEWVRNQHSKDWFEEHGRLDQNGYGIDGKRFIMSEKLYTILALRWL